MHRPLLFSLVVWATSVKVSDFALPTDAQIQYQRHEIVALVHFNMATFFKDGDPGCDASNWERARFAKAFAPSDLNVSAWVDSAIDLGAKSMVLTAKHGCGFLLWPTNVKLPGGADYGYHVGAGGAVVLEDVARSFQRECDRRGLAHGFYFSMQRNFYLCRGFTSGVCHNQVLPGQWNLSDAEFENVSLALVNELWTRYGNLSEVWMDSGYPAALRPKLKRLLSTVQKSAVGGLPDIGPSPMRYVGTESGHPGLGPIWSTGCEYGNVSWPGGNPNSNQWCPANCATTLQRNGKWFWEPQTSIKSLRELISIYHDTVGRNCVLELDFAIDRHGQVEPSHALRYRELGHWIRTCYGHPLGVASTLGQWEVAVFLNSSRTVDRVVLQEDISKGERVRQYVSEAQVDGFDQWVPFSHGDAVGQKKIDIGPHLLRLRRMRVRVLRAWAPPILTLKVYSLCSHVSRAIPSVFV